MSGETIGHVVGSDSDTEFWKEYEKPSVDFWDLEVRIEKMARELYVQEKELSAEDAFRQAEQFEIAAWSRYLLKHREHWRKERLQDDDEGDDFLEK